jgi:uncharacterized damage-inducible protein DinB
MREKIRALRYFVSALALSAAFTLVCFAQQAANGSVPAQAPPQAKEYPANHIEALAQEWTRARDYTKEYLDAMPEDGIGLKPTPDIRSFAEQMLHLANANYAFLSGISGKENPMQGKNLEKMEELTKSKAALTKAVMDSYDFAIGAIKSLTEAKLNEKAELFRLSRPRHAFLAAAFEHQTHHRGQTTIYLRLKGITPPREKLF